MAAGAVNSRPAFAEELRLPAVVPSEAQEIEVVCVDGKKPTVSFKAASPAPMPQPFRPSIQPLDIAPLAWAMRSFGQCATQAARSTGTIVLRANNPAKAHCGHVLSLRQTGAPPDALSYDILHLRGHAQGMATLALVDEAAERRQDNAPVIKLTGPFDVRVPLGPAARMLDLRRLVTIVALIEAEHASIDLTTMVLEVPQARRTTPPARGFWLWKYREALAEAKG